MVYAGDEGLHRSRARRAGVIYIVELSFSDPSREAEWHAWYETYLTQLVSLPGLSTAQRFRAVTPGTQPWTYLALYSVASLEVFASEAYRQMGGGGQASARFREAIRRRRTVYTGIEHLPVVTEAGRVVLCDDARHEGKLADCLFVPLLAATGRRQAGATELDGEPAQRTMAVLATSTLERLNLRASKGLAIYAPLTTRYVSSLAAQG
jgi:hypothetical protein